VVGTRAYRPYGSVLSSAGSASSIYGFTGEQTDPTGLVYLRARMYSPGLGLFTSRDLWPGDDYSPRTFHKFLYSLGNPINLSDPSGLIPLPSTCDGPKRLVFYLDGFGAEVGGIFEGREDIRDFWGQMKAFVPSLEVNNQIYPYALDNDAGFLERIGSIFDALSQDSAIVHNVAAEIDMYAWQAGIETYDPWAEISVVGYSGSSNAGLRATALTLHHIDNLILLGGIFRAEPNDVRHVDHFYDIFGGQDDRRDWPIFSDWDQYNRGWRDTVFLHPQLGPVVVPRYYADKNIYLEPNVSEISVPGVNHTGYFQSAVVANWVYLILGGEWSSFPDPGGLPEW